MLQAVILAAALSSAACPKFEDLKEYGVARVEADGSIVIDKFNPNSLAKNKISMTSAPTDRNYFVFWQHIGKLSAGQSVRVYPAFPGVLGTYRMQDNGDLSAFVSSQVNGVFMDGYVDIPPTDKRYSAIVAGAGGMELGQRARVSFSLDPSCLYDAKKGQGRSSADARPAKE